MKCYKNRMTLPNHLKHVVTIPWEIIHSNFLQIFNRYGRKCKQIAFWVHRWIPVSCDISRTVLWVCGLFSWLKTESLTVSTLNVFFSVGTARSVAAWPPVNCACVPQLFNSLLTPRFVQLFSWNSSINLSAVYPYKYKLFGKILSSSLNTMLIVDKHCSDLYCGKFLVPQIDRKSKWAKQ